LKSLLIKGIYNAHVEDIAKKSPKEGGMIKILLILLSYVYLTEEEAVKRAFENPLIKSKIEEVKSAQYQKNQIFKSFLPQIKSSYSYSYSTFVDKITQPVLVGIDPVTLKPIYEFKEFEFGKSERRTLNLSFEWLLFSGFQRVYLFKMMDAMKNSKLKEEKLKQKEIELLVRMLYSQSLFLKNAIDKYNKILDILEEHIEVAKKRYEAGYTLELDVLRSEAERKSFESQIAEFEKIYTKVLTSLRTFCNIDVNEEIVLTDTLKPDTTFEEKDLKRIDIEVMEENIEMLEYNKKSAYSSFLPKIFCNVNYIYGRPYGLFKDEWGGYWGYFIGVSLDLFDFGKRIDEINKREADKKSLQYVLEFLKKKVKDDLISAKKEFESALKYFKAAKKTLELARKSLSISKDQYEKGFISNTDFLDALRRSLEAEIMYLNSIFKLKDAKMKYESIVYGVSLNF